MAEALDPAAALLRRAEFALLDVRDEQAFRAGHLAGSGSLPRAEFRTRRAELPPRDQPLLVLAATAAEAQAAAAELEALGFGRVTWLDAPLAALAGGLADRAPAA